MRKQVLFTALVAFLNLALFINVNAQGPMPNVTQAAACTLPADAGGQMSATGGMVCETPDPMLTGNIVADLEYIITASDSIVSGTAADGITTIMGPAIVGFDDDGIFNPADYGFENGDNFCVTAVSYNLTEIQAAVDMIFGSSSGVNCCSAIESTIGQSVCVPLCQDAGICSGSDVQGFNSVLDLLAAFGAAPLVENIVDVIENSINTQANSGNPCTEAFPICWALSSSGGMTQSVCYTYDASQCVPTASCGALTTADLMSVVDASGATLSWPAVPDAQAYQLAGRKQGGTIKVFDEYPSTTTSRSFPATSLLPNTTYEWSIRVKCAGVWTDYALPPASFTTPAAKNMGSGIDIFDNVQNLAVELYPNPANTTATLQIASGFDFTFTNTTATFNVQVMDMMGRTINSFKTSETNVEINVSDYADGYYFVSVDNGTEKTVKKMIIAQ